MKNRKRAIQHRALFFLAVVFIFPGHTVPPAYSQGSPFYEWEVIARVGTSFQPLGVITDQINPENSDQPSLNWEVSINDLGQISFGAKTVRSFTNMVGGIGTFVGGDALLDLPESDFLVNATSSRSPSLLGYFNHKLNNDDILVTGGRIWDLKNPGSFTWIDPFELGDPGQLREDFNETRSEDGVVIIVGREDVEDPYSIYKHVGENLELVATPSGTFGSFQRPLVAQGGAMVVKEGFFDSGQILFFDTNGVQQVLHSTTTGFRSLGRYPNISDDGKVVAFVGEGPTGPDGIWLNIFDPAVPASTTYRVFDTATPIGFDANGNAIIMSLLNHTNYVPVIHHDVGGDGLLIGDSIIVSFVGKPSRASRDNPQLPGTPLLFNAHMGIWTLRVDIETNLLGSGALAVNARGVLPVIQLNDQVGTATITNLWLSGSLGRGERNLDGTPRDTLTGRPDPGDHQLAFYVETTEGPMILKGTRFDTDGDGLLDHWERPDGGIDIDRDTTPDLSLADWGAETDHRDLFLEVDWLPPRSSSSYPGGWRTDPDPAALQRLVDMFANAPLNNPDGTPGIRLHIDAGPNRDSTGRAYSRNVPGVDPSLLQGGDAVRDRTGARPDMVHFGTNQVSVYPALKVESFDWVKDNYFGTTDKRARELAFRYCVMADFYRVRTNASAGGISVPLTVDWASATSIWTPTNIDVDTNGVFDVVIKEGDAVMVLTTTGTGVSVPQVRPILATNIIGGSIVIGIDGPRFNPIPEIGDPIVIFSGSGGLAEAFFRLSTELLGTTNNHHTLPGNDMLVTLGAYGLGSGRRLGTRDHQWRLMAHELGHTLGLRHGGNNAFCTHNGDDFWSVMSYTHQNRFQSGMPRLMLGGRSCPGYPKPGHTPLFTLADTRYAIIPPVDFASTNSVPPYFAADPRREGIILSYSDGKDPLGFSDWEYLRLDLYSGFWMVGNTFKKFRGDDRIPGHEDEDDYPTVYTYDVGDRVAPFITLLSPTNRTVVETGGSLEVRAAIFDEGGLSQVQMAVDLDGDGSFNDTNETRQASFLGNDQYAMTFDNLSGPEGERMVRIEAEDLAGNISLLTPRILLGSGTPFDGFRPNLTITEPQSNARVATGSWMVVEFVASDFGSAIDQIVAVFDVNGDGSTNGALEQLVAEETTPDRYQAVFRNIHGPVGFRQIWARATDSWQNETFRTRSVEVVEPNFVPPTITVLSPQPGTEIPLAQPMTVNLLVEDDREVDEVQVSFDVDGSGTILSFERILATDQGQGRYEAVFNGFGVIPSGITGQVGPRNISVEATDLAENRAALSWTVQVADLSAPSILIQSPTEGAALGLGTTLELELEAFDDQAITDVIATFDIDGDGSTTGPGERLLATSLGLDRYQASFPNLTGPEGTRSITLTAQDPTLKSTTVTRQVNVAQGGIFHEPAESQDIPLATTFLVRMEVASGLEVSNVVVTFDVNGNGALDEPGEQVLALTNDQARIRLASFSNVSGPPGSRTIAFTVADMSGGMTSKTRDVTIGPYGGFAGASSIKLGAIPFLPEQEANGNDASSGPQDFVVAGTNLFFTAFDPVAGRELFRTDGSRAGTLLLKDINPDKSSLNPLDSAIDYATAFQGALYFAAQDWHGSSFGFQPPHLGKELWKSDGTVDGTILLKDIREGGEDGLPAHLAVFDGRLFFSARDNGAGRELWVSDGTGPGTSLFLDINPGPPGSNPEQLEAAESHLFFLVHGKELWLTDGTTNGTQLVRDLRPGQGGPAGVANMTAVGDLLFFTVIDPDHGTELWASDGTEPGTAMLGDLYPGQTGSMPQDLVAFQGQLLFSALAPDSGRELWASDGTPSGTRLLKDILPGSLSADPAGFTPYQGIVYFSANDGIEGRELWLTDGSSNGTRLAVNIAAYNGPLPLTGRLYPSRSSSPEQLTVAGNDLFFVADDGTGRHGRELWKSDGSQGGTMMVRDLTPEVTRPLLSDPNYIEPRDSLPESLTSFGGHLYFQARDAYGSELWRSDGTAAGTVKLRNLRHGAAGPIADSQPGLILQGADGIHGREPWRWLGSDLAMVADINPGPSNSSPVYVTQLQDDLIIASLEDYNRFSRLTNGAVYRAERDLSSIHQLRSFDTVGAFAFEGFYPAGSNLLFVARDSLGLEPWVTDGTSNGTVRLMDIRSGSLGSDPRYPTLFRDQWYFQAYSSTYGREIWRTDGTTNGTSLFLDLNPGSGHANPGKFTVASNHLFFVGYDGSRGFELWKTDGTTNGTEIVKDIASGNASAFESTSAEYLVPFIPFRGSWFFAADDGINGRELWKTDGTRDGTLMVRDINDTALRRDSNPEQLTVVGDTLYFTARSAFSEELWKSDGTTEGTVLVKNIRGRDPRGFEQSSSPDHLVEVNGILMFTAMHDDFGRELWRSDGSLFGTVLVRDLFPGPRSSSFDHPVKHGTQLYFVADNPRYGRELWISDGTFEGTHPVEDLVPGPGSAQPSQLTRIDDKLTYFANDGADDLSLRQAVPDLISPFEAWLDQVSNLTGDARLLSADADGDGLSNASEFDLESDPDDPDSRGPRIEKLTVWEEDGWRYLEVSLLVRKPAEERYLRFSLERSSHFQSWVVAPPLSQSITPWNDTHDLVRLQIRRPASESQQFLRVTVGVFP